MDKIKVVVVGYGGMGGYHADKIRKMDKFELLGIYDIKDERRKAAEENGIRAYNSFEEVLADDSAELITCATYNDCHKEIVIRALEAGKNVISEKPVTLCSEDLEEMIAVAEKTGRLFTVHQNRRWDNDYRTIKNIYDKNELGKVHQIDSRVYGSQSSIIAVPFSPVIYQRGASIKLFVYTSTRHSGPSSNFITALKPSSTSSFVTCVTVA